MHVLSLRLEPIGRSMQNQREDLLAFAGRLDEDLDQLGRDFQISTELPRRLLGAVARRARPEALDRGSGRARAPPEPVPRGSACGRGVGRGDGPGQFVDRKPQQSAADLLFSSAGTWARTIWRRCSST